MTTPTTPSPGPGKASPVKRVLDRLDQLKKSGSGWTARCPAHEDKRASLSVAEGEGGRALLHCFAGCSVESIVESIGLRMNDLRAEQDQPRGSNGKPRIVATYPYTDSAANLLFEVVRRSDKSFLQRQPDGNGGWIWNMKDVVRVPYGLPELAAAPGAPVFIPEGEKDVETLRRLGLVATTSPGGAGKWLDSYSAYLEGRDVFVLPDNDGPGRAHAEQVARSVSKVARSVKVVNLPGLAPKADASDWAAAGGTAAALVELAEAAPPWAPQAATGSEAKQKDAKPERAKKPTPAELGESFLETHKVICAHGRLYVYRGGFYQCSGELLARTWVQDRLGKQARRIDGDELVYWLSNRCRVDEGALDHGDLINVANGLLEWRSGSLRPHTADVLSTVQLPTEWHPEAYEPRCDLFLDEVMPDPEARVVVEEFAGYSLWPDCRFQKALMLTGRGENGKSKVVEWLAATLGKKNCSTLRLQDLDSKFRTHELLGRLVNLCADLPRQAVDDSGTFKMLVTGDDVTAEQKFRNPISFVNRAKLIFSANELPGTRDRSAAYFRRWIVVDFPRQFVVPKEGEELPDGALPADTSLADKLCCPAGRSYLLRLAVEGLRRLEARGHFCETQTMREAVAEYRRQADHIVAFYEERCEYAAGDWTSKDQVFSEYLDWAKKGNNTPVSDNIFCRRLLAIEPRIRPSKRGGRESRKPAFDGLRLVSGFESRDPGHRSTFWSS